MVTGRRNWLNLWAVTVISTSFLAQWAQADSAGLAPSRLQDKHAVPLSVVQIPLNHKDNSITSVGKLHYLGGLKITSPQGRFGGISGFEISPDGRQILGISDHDHWMVADLVYNQEHHLISLENVRMAPFKMPLDPKQPLVRDAEAVTALDGAGYVVSFETPHSLRYFQARKPYDFESLFSARAQKITFAPDLAEAYASLPRNLGIEALTTLPGGQMLAFSENTITEDGKTWARGWLIGHGKVETLRYEINASYKPTDMATLPNGDILVLERHFSLAKGMAARLTRLPALAVKAGKDIRGEIVADMAFPFNLDNMEALAVRQNEAGETIIYIMSDNNYSRLQRNILMMFRLGG